MTDGGAGIHYHCTTLDRMPSIRREGLVTGKRRRWSNTYGMKLGHPKSVYLLSDFDAAVRWAAKMEFDLGKPVCLIRVRTPEGLVPDEQFEQTRGPFSFRSGTGVPPDGILSTFPLTPELRREAVEALKAGERLVDPETSGLAEAPRPR